MKRLFICIVSALAATAALAQPMGGGFPSFAGFFGPRVDTVRIWPDGAPNAYEFQAPANQDPARSIAKNYSERDTVHDERQHDVDGVHPARVQCDGNAVYLAYDLRGHNAISSRRS